MTTYKDLCLPQSSMYRMVITVVGGPTNIVGWYGEMQIRKTKSDPAVLAEMLPSYFTSDDPNRQLILEIPDEATSAYDWDGWAVYDLYLSNGTDRWRLLEGRVQLDKTVTRS